MSGDVITNHILPFMTGNEILYLVNAAPPNADIIQKVEQKKQEALTCDKAGNKNYSLEKIVLMSGDDVLGIAQIVICFFCFF